MSRRSMQELKPALRDSLLVAASDGTAATVDYWLYGTVKIDVVLVGEAPHAFLISRSKTEAVAKAKVAASLFEHFHSVTVMVPSRTMCPILPGWIGVQTYESDSGGTSQQAIVPNGHCDFRYRGCLAHLKTPDLIALLKSHSRPTSKLSRWEREQEALELPLNSLRAWTMDALKSRFAEKIDG